ncbi:CBS domain-containing protein [Candidatus Woesearchaeota archaeon]|nr:CBS domain-containing protein [Candidatus Aenigmarchaeota archaeon]MBI2646996.1 CBS domain-containing protein [Candidatus Woesearchaeota archaeon]
MRLPELKTIKNMRKQMGINQTELAKAAGVSQSLIARLEAGRVDPSYQKVKKIFLALENVGSGRIPKAKDIMSKHVATIRSNLSVKDAAKLMKNKKISQLPVVDDGVVVGSVSEKTLIDKVAQGLNFDNLALVPIKDLMDEAFPQIDENSSISVVSTLLEYNAAVLVTSKGKINGVVTKADLLKLV